MTPKEQKIEYWRVSEYSSLPEESLDEFVDRNYKDGWYVHQIISLNASTYLDAAYIVFYKF